MAGNARIYRSTFINNNIYGFSSGIVYGVGYSATSGIMYLDIVDSYFYNNTANQASIYLYGTVISINNTKFVNNTSPTAGGAIAVEDFCTLSLFNNVFSGNGQTATFPGKAINCIAGGMIIASGGNTFCGIDGNSVVCKNATGGNFTTPALTTAMDSCGVCDGTDVDLDCASQCFGGLTVENGICGFCANPSSFTTGTTGTTGFSTTGTTGTTG